MTDQPKTWAIGDEVKVGDLTGYIADIFDQEALVIFDQNDEPNWVALSALDAIGVGSYALVAANDTDTLHLWLDTRYGTLRNLIDGLEWSSKIVNNVQLVPESEGYMHGKFKEYLSIVTNNMPRCRELIREFCKLGDLVEVESNV